MILYFIIGIGVAWMSYIVGRIHEEYKFMAYFDTIYDIAGGEDVLVGTAHDRIRALRLLDPDELEYFINIY